MRNMSGLAQRRIAAMVLLLAVAVPALAAQPAAWTGVDRIVAVGDVHGDCDQLVAVLRAAKVIDEKNQWIAGKTHLVQTGDILDRGPTSRKAMDLMMELEPQAEKAGGQVHVLLGNHEAMVLLGDLRYMTEEEIESFGGDTQLKKEFAADGKYGKWIRTHNAAIKINDTLFVHAGLDDIRGKMPLEKLNDAVRKDLAEGSEKGLAMHWAGPLWYRGNALMTGADLEADLKPILETHGVSRIVIGHTVTRTQRIEMRPGGRIIMIDVGMSKTYRKGPAACLVIEKGVLSAIYAGKGEEKLVAPKEEKDKEREAAGD